MNENDLQRMSHMMRHRLRNIATGLRGSLSLIEEEVIDSLSPGLAEYFPLIYRECDALQTIANRFNLLFDRLAEVAPRSADEILQKVAHDVSARFPSVTFRIQGGCHNKVDGILETALTELLVNACEASPSGIVETRLETKSGKVHWIVLDTGDGLDSVGDGLDCFAPFTTTRPRHLGLGLPIARRLCEQAGGACDVYVTANDPDFRGGVVMSAAQR
jgi:signal transduction histidine kinase